MTKAARGFWASDLNRAVVDLLDPGPGLVLLDLGAGLGPATMEAAPRVAPQGRVIAIDPSRATRFILGARRSWQRARRSIDIRNGAAERLPLASGSVDAAWAVNAAHHFDDLERATAELARVLKPGGRLLLVEEDFIGGHGPARGRAEPDHGPIAIDTRQLATILTSEGFDVAESDDRVIGGVPASVMLAVRRPSAAVVEVDPAQPDVGA